MKSKQINKFLLMFFISFTLFFSVSYAEFSSGVWLNVVTSATRTQHKETVIDNYTYAQIYNIIKNYYADQATYKSSYDNLITAINNNNYDYVITHNYYTNDVYQIFIFKNLEVGHWVNSDNYLCFTGKNDGSNILMHPDNQNGYGEKLTDFSYVFGAKFLGTLSIEYSTVPIKELTRSSSQAFWDGSSYFYEIPGAEEPDIPSFDYDLAGIIDVIKNSTEVQDNIYPYLEEYFIVPNGTVNDEQVFSIYFYYPSVNLSQFEYSYNDVLYYDLDKISIDGVISNLTYYLGGNTSSNVVKDVQLATLYYNLETCTGDVYFTGNRTFDQLKSFESKTQPIIYTTKDIAYYSATWGETDTEWTAVPDTTKNILSSEITDSEGNIVDPVLPGSSSVVLGDTPFERFVNVIQTAFLGLVESISKGLISFTDYLLQIFGENVVTFVFLVVIKSITVLVSSVALIFRFISFIMTLVAIPASSALLAVDVATNSSGLVFTGLNWGTHFIDGLNFIKAIQWNGLGLWTLFEVFVASLEVVLFVKIVRRHYRTL